MSTTTVTALARRRPRQGTVIALLLCLVLAAVGTTASSAFLAAGNLRQLATFASFVGIAAIGQTLVIIAGGLDLSVPWVIALGGIELSLLAQRGVPGPVGILVVLAAGGVVGAVNGVGVAWLRLPPIVMTLAVGGLVHAYLLAVGLLKSEGNTVPHAATALAGSRLGPLPVAALVWVGLAAVTWLLLQRTVLGRNIHAAGASEVVARLAGVSVPRTRFLTYVLSGVCSAFAGVMIAGQLGSAYVEVGSPYLFTSIAAVVVGGASMLGGSGSYAGTFFGALALTLLSAVLPLLHLDPAELDIAYGVVIILAGASALTARAPRWRRRPAGGGT
jgi:ribose transport system permease protein